MDPSPTALTFNQLPQPLRARLVEATRGRDPAVILTRRNKPAVRLRAAAGVGAFALFELFVRSHHHAFLLPQGPDGLAVVVFGLTFSVLYIGRFILRRTPYVPSVLAYAGTEVDLTWDGRVWVRPLPRASLTHTVHRNGGYAMSSLSVGVWFSELIFDRAKAEQQFAHILGRVRLLAEASSRRDFAECARLDPFAQWPDRVPPTSPTPDASAPRAPEHGRLAAPLFVAIAATVALLVRVAAP